ncbi:MAG: serine/threonine-protein kinase, partial [Planctomycetota bacterium]
TRTDIYSLGATLYFMVTGRPPFDGAATPVIIQQHVYGKLEWPVEANPSLSDDICRVIAKMMMKEPGDRYQEPKGLLRDIDALKAGGEPDIDNAALRESTIAVPAHARKKRQRPGSGPRHGRPASTPRRAREHGARRGEPKGGGGAVGAPPGRAFIARTGLLVGLGVGALIVGLVAMLWRGEVKPPDPEPSVHEAAMARAREHMRLGEWRRSAEVLEEALAQKPGDAEAGRLLAEAKRRIVTPPPPPPPPPPGGLVGHWKFDEKEGSPRSTPQGEGATLHSWSGRSSCPKADASVGRYVSMEGSPTCPSRRST